MQASSDPDELLDIYSILGRLNCFRGTEYAGASKDSQNESDLFGNKSLFPRRFLLKLLDERLADLNELAKELVEELFDYFNLKRKTKPRTDNQLTKLSFVDEYFHNALYYLYDFLIELEWHESDIADLPKSDQSYAKGNLKLISRFLVFQKFLATQNSDLSTAKSAGRPYVLKTLSPARRAKRDAIKSSLSVAASSRIESPSRRRRVRFTETPVSPSKRVATPNDSNNLISPSTPAKQYRDLDDGKSVLALDLLIFAIDLFVQQLCEQFLRWQTSGVDIKGQINLVVNANRKLRSQQLASISRNIKFSNDVCLVLLDHLNAIKQTYLNDCIIKTLCAHDSKPLLEGYKIPRTNYYTTHIDVDVEQKLLTSLAKQNLQVILDLVVHEMNLPPLELGSETKTKSRDEVSRSRTNYLNLIGNWLGVGLFSSETKTSQKGQETTPTIATVAEKPVGEPLFKSSSRILAQMDNLNELTVHLVSQLINRFQSKQQSRYFLETLMDGVQVAFELIGQDLKVQADSFQLEAAPNDSKAPQRDIDLIVVKTRCLKLEHILHSFENLCNDLSSKHDLGVSFEAAIPEFILSSTSAASGNK